MKIFVSYSRRDAGDFANQIQRHLSTFNYDVFTDVNSIGAGEIWSNTIETNISNCNIFVVIVTRGALLSPHVEREVLQAQKENKKIIPCFFKNINPNQIKWGLEKIQGVEFSDKYELARELDFKINVESNIPSDKGTKSIIDFTSKTIKDVKTNVLTVKSDIDKEIKKEDLQPKPKGRIGALGNGELSVPSKTPDVGKTRNKYNIDKLEKKRDTSQQPQKVAKIDKSKVSDIATDTTHKEETKPPEKDTNKLNQGIFGSTSKTVKDTKTPTSTSIKSDIENIHQKKDKVSYSNVNLGAIGGEMPSHPKYTSPEYDNNETEYSAVESSTQSQGIYLKLIIIPIIAVAVIGVILTVSYFNGVSFPDENKPSIVSPPPTSGTTEKAVTSPPTSGTTGKTYQFITAWGSNGTENGEFNDPSGVFFDSSTGYVYVADSKNHRIQKFDSNGNFITKWGSQGTGNGQFNNPNSIAVDSKGYVYVSDYYNHRIQKFDSNKTFIKGWGRYGTEDGAFAYPQGIAVDSFGDIYIADSGNERIQKFDSNGHFITKWGNWDAGSDENGRFYGVYDTTVDSSTGYVYAVDMYNHRIQKFDSNGNFITKWGSEGSGDREFKPYGITVDSSTGYVYVTDWSDSYNIKQFDSNGTFIAKWGSEGSGDGQFIYPSDITVDSSTGYVYVADSRNNRIQIFAPSK